MTHYIQAINEHGEHSGLYMVECESEEEFERKISEFEELSARHAKTGDWDTFNEAAKRELDIDRFFASEAWLKL